MGHIKDNAKKRKWKQLSEKERYQIELMTRMKKKPIEIAEQIGRDRRTIIETYSQMILARLEKEAQYGQNYSFYPG